MATQLPNQSLGSQRHQYQMVLANLYLGFLVVGGLGPWVLNPVDGDGGCRCRGSVRSGGVSFGYRYTRVYVVHTECGGLELRWVIAVGRSGVVGCA